MTTEFGMELPKMIKTILCALYAHLLTFKVANVAVTGTDIPPQLRLTAQNSRLTLGQHDFVFPDLKFKAKVVLNKENSHLFLFSIYAQFWYTITLNYLSE